MSHINGFEYQPTKDLNLIIRQYGIACLSNTTPAPPSDSFVNIAWQTDMLGNISAYIPVDEGGGGVNPGSQFRLPFYAAAGSVVSETNLTVDATGNNLTVPGTLTAEQQATFNAGMVSSGPDQVGTIATVLPTMTYPDGAISRVQQVVSAQYVGTGFNFGSSGGWTVLGGSAVLNQSFVRGIGQAFNIQNAKESIGDSAGAYIYNRHEGGFQALDDEGASGITVHNWQNQGYFTGSVTATSGTGDTHPSLTASGGNGFTTDGAILINTSKGTLSGNLNGESVPVSLTTTTGPSTVYLNALPVTGVTLPLSTAIGVSTAPIRTFPATAVTTANNPQLTTVVVNLVSIGGVFKTFTVGSVVSVAGINYPEQSKIITATTTGTNQQTLTLLLRNPNPQAIIFQGGIQGQFLSFDANLAFGSGRSAYNVYGSLTGTDMIYALYPQGQASNAASLPMVAVEAATTTGANSGFHLFPGAEVVASAPGSPFFEPTLEQNGVVWAVNDLVENPHPVMYEATAAWLDRFQQTPGATDHILLSMAGPGIGGPGSSVIRAINNNPNSNYSANGGPLQAPDLIHAQGNFSNCFFTETGPDQTTGGFLLGMNNPANSADSTINFVALGVNGSNILFNRSALSYEFEANVSAGVGFQVDGSIGVAPTGSSPVTFTSADGKTVTVIGGIITSVV